MVYARIADGVVAELFTPPEGTTLDQCFTPELAAMLVPVPSGSSAVAGWTYDGTTFAAPAPIVATTEQLAAQGLAAAIASGLTLTSTGQPGLNATYALDPVSTAQIFQIGLYAAQFSTFPGGGSSLFYPDINGPGVAHNFNTTQFVNFLHAVAGLIFQLQEAAAEMAAGGTPTWPAQTATIA